MQAQSLLPRTSTDKCIYIHKDRLSSINKVCRSVNSSRDKNISVQDRKKKEKKNHIEMALRGKHAIK